jgi:ceramide glucosyltransferase
MLIDSGFSLLAAIVDIFLAGLTFGGVVYMLLALLGARQFVRDLRRDGAEPGFAADVTILKPVKGVDARMYAGFCSHCRQEYPGRYELLFGVTTLDDPAVSEVERLRDEFPQIDIRLVECPERLGSSGKVSNLVQMLREAKYEHVVINDSDIEVSPRYLQNVMRGFGDPKVGLVTAPYIGATAARGPDLTVWAKLEALGISTDFMAGVLTARRLESGMHYGLGSTLATTKTALAAIGGLELLANALADDYEMGRRISRAGYKVELCGEVVRTTVPAYRFRGFWDHQIRWARTVRDARRWGYLGLGVTYCLPWAMLTVVASGFALWSFTLLSLVLLARVTVALTVGVGVLRDEQVLRDLWLLPLRDCFGLLIWLWSFAGDTVVWRGEEFRLKDGRIARI